MFYLTEQGTQTVWTTPRLAPGAKWSVYGNISHATVPEGVVPEDPYVSILVPRV